MSDALKNPDLPPGALVETFDDGSALRNDGVKPKSVVCTGNSDWGAFRQESSILEWLDVSEHECR